MAIQRFLSSSEAARVLGVTPATVRLMVRRGDLEPAAMTEGGMHLFRRPVVERFALQRDKLLRLRAAQRRERER